MQKDTLRIQNDMGHSVLRKKILRYVLNYNQLDKNNLKMSFLIKTLTKYEENPLLYKNEDNEFLRIILKEYSRVKFVKNNEDFPKILSLIQKVLENSEFSHVFYFAECI
jgi:hypothetical protein